MKTLICPHGTRIQKMMEELHPGYCEKHCGKWKDTRKGMHFMEYHEQVNDCAHRFELCAHTGRMAG